MRWEVCAGGLDPYSPDRSYVPPSQLHMTSLADARQGLRTVDGCVMHSRWDQGVERPGHGCADGCGLCGPCGAKRGRARAQKQVRLRILHRHGLGGPIRDAMHMEGAATA